MLSQNTSSFIETPTTGQSGLFKKPVSFDDVGPALTNLARVLTMTGSYFNTAMDVCIQSQKFLVQTLDRMKLSEEDREVVTAASGAHEGSLKMLEKSFGKVAKEMHDILEKLAKKEL